MGKPAELNSFVGSVVEDRYRIEAEIGAGAMGTVYRGRHVKVGRTVAIKVLHDYLVREPLMVERFEREARIAARLKHPNLVTVIDLGATPDGKKLMVLEFAPGHSLAELVIMPLARERVIDLARQLLCGLDHAHSAGLIHRDLKPENVLVERTAEGNEIPRIVDFGIAVLRDADESVEGRRLTSSGMVLGTPMYMAPEQARGERVDHRADLYSLGVMVYEMLCGKPPFEGSGVEIMMLNIAQDAPSIATRTGRDVDPLLEAFAHKLKARSRGDRFQTAKEALEVLELITTDRDTAAIALGLASSVPEQVTDDAMITTRHCKPPVPQQDDTPPRKRRWGAMFGAAAFVTAGVATFVLTFALMRSRTGEAAQLSMPPSPIELEPTVRGTAMLPPLPVESTFLVPEEPVAAPLRIAVAIKRVVIAPAAHVVAPRIETHDLIEAQDSAELLAQKYIRVGRALRDHNNDDQWQRFRLIRLDDAMATPQTRRVAIEILDGIVRELN